MSKIEWTNKSWNPITGCSPISPGCANCYAKGMSNRLKGRWGYDGTKPFEITFHQDRLLIPLYRKKPCMYFVNSMGDIFHENVPDEWRDIIFRVIYLCPQHVFTVLTKRAENMKRYFNNIVETYGVEIPSNIWAGVTAENQEMADLRLPHLIDTQVANRFISVEPLLGPVDLSTYINSMNWVIVGAETGVRARYMEPNWAMAIKNLCLVYNVPFFFKKMSRNIEPPMQLNIREFPNKNWLGGSTDNISRSAKKNITVENWIAECIA